MTWQSYLQFIEQFLAALDSRWRSLLPDSATPEQQSLITLGAFVAISLILLLVGRILIGRGRNRVPESEAVGSRRPLVLGIWTEAFAWLVPISRRRQGKLRKELTRAGYYHRKALEEFLGFRNAALMGWLLFVGCAVVVLANPKEDVTPKVLAVGAVVLVLIYSIPRLVLSAQSNSRSHRIHYSMPDALDLVNMTVTGGLPLREAIKRAGQVMRRSHPDIACELAIVDRQAEAGSMEQALRQFASRIELPDVIALAAMVRHADQLGGDVADAFRTFSDSIRRTRRQRAEERGNKTSVKLLFPVVLFLAPPIYIMLLGPAAVELKNFVQREQQPGGALSQTAATSLDSATRIGIQSSATLGRRPPADGQ